MKQNKEIIFETKKTWCRKTCIITAILTIILTAFSCKKEENKATIAPPVKVTVTEIGGSNAEESPEYSGTVSASESTTVSFSVAGTITELFVKEGDKVNKGQLLGKIRNGEYLNAYNIAEAQLAEAQDGYERLKKLHDANALPDVKWVEIQQKLKQAENAAEMAKRSLNDASLHSPVSGTVTRKFVDLGQTIMPVEPVYEIVSLNALTIDIPLSENEIGYFTKGEEARVYIDAIPGEIKGRVSQKDITADPLTRTYNVKIEISNSDGKILPGMIGKVYFDNKTREDSIATNIVLPTQAVLLNYDNRWFVWVVKDSVAERRFVTADELVATGVVIKSGLDTGDLVITEGMRKVGTGTKVIPERK